MIRSIAIERIRGIRSGALTDLSPLTVLVGRNGCAKSTLLESLLIGAATSPGDAIGHAVRRRIEMRNGARWLLWDAGDEGPGRILVTNETDRRRDWTLQLVEPEEDLRRLLIAKGAEGPYAEILGSLSVPESKPWEVRVGIAADNSYRVLHEDAPPDRGKEFSSWLVDSRTGSPRLSLDRLYSRASIHGRRDEVFTFIKEVLPDFKQLEVLTEADSSSALYMHLSSRARPVPVAVSGDGIVALVRLSCELAASVAGTLLLEEPEMSMHPGAVYQSARVIQAAVRRGIQIILSTHSIELIDALLAAADEEALEKLTVYRLRLDEGLLQKSRYEGAQVRFARESIAEDLR